MLNVFIGKCKIIKIHISKYFIKVIVLLILAGISIGMLSGDNGILGQAGNAKTQTGVGQEKEIVALAYNSSNAFGKT